MFTRIWLALFGEWSWDDLPVMPPELIYLPGLVPAERVRLGVLGTPDDRAADHRRLAAAGQEAAVQPRRAARAGDGSSGAAARLPTSGRKVVRADSTPGCTATRSTCGRSRPASAVRRAAMRRCAEWIIARQEKDGCWGGIQPPWVYSLHGAAPARLRPRSSGHRARPGRARPVHDLGGHPGRAGPAAGGVPVTGLGHRARDGRAGRRRAARPTTRRWWRPGAGCSSEEIRGPGDWQVQRPWLAPGGWAFEFDNDGYPDVDDTAEVVLALRRARRGRAPSRSARARRLADRHAVPRRRLGRVRRRQHHSGWSTKLPFCDFGEVIDPPSADVTAHTDRGARRGRARPEQGGAPGRGLAAAGPGGGRLLVRPVGRQLRVRDRRGGARADRGRGAAGQAGDQAGGAAG